MSWPSNARGGPLHTKYDLNSRVALQIGIRLLPTQAVIVFVYVKLLVDVGCAHFHHRNADLEDGYPRKSERLNSKSAKIVSAPACEIAQPLR